MDFRIGINLGDVLHKDDRIYGNSVNIYKILLDPKDAGKVVSVSKKKTLTLRWMVVAIVALIAVVGAAATYRGLTASKPGF